VGGLFVTATDTGAGKSVLAAALVAAMADSGERVLAHKPVLTGTEEAPGAWPPDDELLASAAGMDPEQVAPLRFGPAVSPHLAAALEDRPIDPAGVLDRARRAVCNGTAVIEGVGGILVPLTEQYTVADLARELGLPVLIAARADLGTINHTLLTLAAARAHGLSVAAVILTPWPGEPSTLQRSNRETIASMGAVDVEVLAHLSGPHRTELARAGQRLPWRSWLGR
jgi:dethiobiotin synthetase